MDPGFLVDRKKELEKLNWILNSAGKGLVLVYGRRRIGKTRLITDWLQGKQHVYYQAGFWSHNENLKGFTQALEDQLGIPGLRNFTGSLRDLFNLLSRLVKEPVVIVLDEFTYWARVYPGIVSDLQWIVDHLLPNTNIVLVISGSSIGVMEAAIMGGGSPLYGRSILRIKLRELEPWCIPWFVPSYSEEDLVATYTLYGGVPHYLKLIDDSHDPLSEWLRLFGADGLLPDEAYFILRDEVRDPAPYQTILKALASRLVSSPGKIAGETGIPLSHVSMYISKMALLELVEQIKVLFGARKKYYRVKDKLLRSNFYLHHPMHIIKHTHRKDPRIIEKYMKLLSLGWEELAENHSTYILSRELGINPDMIGKLIKGREEVDWIIIDMENKIILAVEAKWSTLSFSDIEKQARILLHKLYKLLPTKYSDYTIHLALYVKNVKKDKPNISLSNVHLVTLHDLPWKTGCS